MRCDMLGVVWCDGECRCLPLSSRSVQMCFSSSPCVPVECCCVQSVSTSPTAEPCTPLHAAADRCTPLTSVHRVFQDVAARGLHLPQVTWILQVRPGVSQ